MAGVFLARKPIGDVQLSPIGPFEVECEGTRIQSDGAPVWLRLGTKRCTMSARDPQGRVLSAPVPPNQPGTTVCRFQGDLLECVGS